MRAEIVGQEFHDVHHGVYSWQFTPREKLHGVRSEEFSSLSLNVIDWNKPIEESL